ncbi:MAG: SDR family NAD(P)-dependent oxidoreductase [Rhodospirillales bacterium]|nr:MAG: SDR family NAD(P)-dependent oxidoreductase [Rhodospirillales bacterium]
MSRFKSILITGASSGIGAALAVDYAAAGVRLALTGRDTARLEAVAATCRARGATVDTATIDVTDREAFAVWLGAQDAAHPFDLVIANAGVALEKGRDLGDGAALRRTLEINVDGVLNTILPLLPAMRARRAGQVAIVSSLAGFVGLPLAPGYNASKAAVRILAESLRLQLRRDGVGVTAVCPGFVVSPMTDGNKFPMPFLMPVARASAIIRRGLERDRARIAFPWPLRAGVWLAQALPAALSSRLLGRAA